MNRGIEVLQTFALPLGYVAACLIILRCAVLLARSCLLLYVYIQALRARVAAPCLPQNSLRITVVDLALRFDV